MQIPMDEKLYLTEHLSDLQLSIYFHYLGISHISQLRTDYDVFSAANLSEKELVEIWEIPMPELFDCELRINDVSTPGMAIGCIQFGLYNGRKVILEQNLSPLLVYWRAVE